MKIYSECYDGTKTYIAGSGESPDTIKRAVQNGHRVYTYSVQDGGYDNDLYCGTLRQCKREYLKLRREGYDANGGLTGIALIEIDENCSFVYCHDVIEDSEIS